MKNMLGQPGSRSTRTTALPAIIGAIYGTLISVDVGPSYHNVRERSIRMSIRNNDGVFLPVRMPYDEDYFAKLQDLRSTWVYVNLESVTVQDYYGLRPQRGVVEDQRVAFNARLVERAL